MLLNNKKESTKPCTTKVSRLARMAASQGSMGGWRRSRQAKMPSQVNHAKKGSVANRPPPTKNSRYQLLVCMVSFQLSASSQRPYIKRKLSSPMPSNGRSPNHLQGQWPQDTAIRNRQFIVPSWCAIFQGQSLRIAYQKLTPEQCWSQSHCSFPQTKQSVHAPHPKTACIHAWEQREPVSGISNETVLHRGSTG